MSLLLRVTEDGEHNSKIEMVRIKWLFELANMIVLGDIRLYSQLIRVLRTIEVEYIKRHVAQLHKQNEVNV